MKKIFFLNLFLLFSVGEIYSQQIQRCSTDESEFLLLNVKPSLKNTKDSAELRLQSFIHSFVRSSDIITIPVVVHLIGDIAIAQAASKVQDQINILNQDYGMVSGSPGDGDGVNTGIQFCLASQDPYGNSTTGVINIAGVYAPFGLYDDVALKSLSNWSPEKYLNIWVCDVASNLLGWGTFPYQFLGGSDEYQDGVVVGYKYFGYNPTAAPYSQGRTLTHEIGHWLNLYHTFTRHHDPNLPFEGECLNLDCLNNGDCCCDTPPVWNTNNGSQNGPGPNYGCPTGINTCITDDPDLPDMIHDYMDYTDDACMNMFTFDQTTRMLATLSGPRASLTYSNVCQPIGSADNGGDSGGDGGNFGGANFVACNGVGNNFSVGFGINNQYDGVAYICENDPIFISGSPPHCIGFPWIARWLDGDGDPCNWWQEKFGDCHTEYDFSYFTSFYECNDDLSTTGHPEYLTNRFIVMNHTNNNGVTIFDPASYNMYDINSYASSSTPPLTLTPGKFYRFKLGGTYQSNQAGYAESASYFYIVPDNLLLENRSLLSDQWTGTNKYIAKNTITISNSTEAAGQKIDVVAGNSIDMLPGTDIKGTFTARINNVDCNSPQSAMPPWSGNSETLIAKGASQITNLNYTNSSNANSNNNQTQQNIALVTNNIGIVPNPNNGSFQISVTKNNQTVGVKDVKVYDMIGKVIWENNTPLGNLFNVDISGYAPGIYYVRAINEAGDIDLKKLIKQ